MTRFDLIITADYPNRTAEFRLLDEHGGQPAELPAPLRRGGEKSRGVPELQAAVDDLLDQARQAATVPPAP